MTTEKVPNPILTEASGEDKLDKSDSYIFKIYKALLTYQERFFFGIDKKLRISALDFNLKMLIYESKLRFFGLVRLELLVL
jgi:hypothetical protein